MNHLEHYDNLIKRLKNLKEFEIQTKIPNQFRFNGEVPFDCTIVGDQVFVKLYAESFEEAQKLVKEFFTKKEDYE